MAQRPTDWEDEMRATEQKPCPYCGLSGGHTAQYPVVSCLIKQGHYSRLLSPAYAYQKDAG